MNTQDKKIFIDELTNAVKVSILHRIDADAIPDEWDGIELRQYIADQFNAATVKMSRDRKRDYNNTILISGSL